MQHIRLDLDPDPRPFCKPLLRDTAPVHQVPKWSGYRLLHTVFAASPGTAWQVALQQDPACILARFSTRHGWGRAVARLSLASHCNIWGALRLRGAGYSVHDCAARKTEGSRSSIAGVSGRLFQFEAQTRRAFILAESN